MVDFFNPGRLSKPGLIYTDCFFLCTPRVGLPGRRQRGPLEAREIRKSRRWFSIVIY